jgi:hypothetical protein
VEQAPRPSFVRGWRAVGPGPQARSSMLASQHERFDMSSTTAAAGSNLHVDAGCHLTLWLCHAAAVVGCGAVRHHSSHNLPACSIAFAEHTCRALREGHCLSAPC